MRICRNHRKRLHVSRIKILRINRAGKMRIITEHREKKILTPDDSVETDEKARMNCFGQNTG